MKCPICKCRDHIELDLHADGFAQDLRECSDCGSIWTFSRERLVVVVRGDCAEGTD
jgi:Zn ribbon nucleic-acid-binding protein